MSVIALASAKSSPGVSLLAELVVQLFPGGRRAVLLECDPAGGDWLLRPGATREPGLVSLATAGRRELAGDELLGHLQRFGAGLEVLVGPAAARQAWKALELVRDRLVAHLRQLEKLDAVVDCGTLSPASPALPVVRAADLVVLVSRPTARAVVHLAPWVEQLVDEGAAVVVALAEGPTASRQEPVYRPDEVAEALGTVVVGPVVHDPPAAARIAAEPGRLDRVAETALVRSVAPVAEAIFARVARTSSSDPFPAQQPAVSR
jgi:MinD-like ATPase involved in chromosome partitioning or flagellar assembly